MSTVPDVQAVPFFLESFVSRVPGTSVPVTEFAAGAPIELVWESNGTAFTLYAARDPQPLYSGPATSFTVPAGRQQATTFVLVAAVTGGPASGAPYPGFQSITLTDAVTVAISNPTITPAAVTTGALTVTGATTLGTASATSVQVGGTLQATGLATLSGGLKAGPVTVTGASSLTGGATVDAMTVNGALGATTAHLANVTASTLTVTTAVSMLNPRPPIQPGPYTPSSDGLVVGAVNWPDSTSSKCSGVVWGWTQASGYVCGTGGNTVAWGNGSGSAMAGIGGSFTLPVQAGVPFKIGVQRNGPDVDAPVQFTWVPFGTNATLTALSDDEIAAAGFVEQDFSQPSSPQAFDPNWAIAEIVNIFNEYSGVAITAEEEQRLTSALQVLATHDASLTYVPTLD